MVLWLTNQGPFVSPLPTDLKLPVQVQEATTRTKKKKTGKGKDYPWGQGLGAVEDYGDSISVPPPKPPTKKSRWRLLEFLVIFLDDYAKIKGTIKTR